MAVSNINLNSDATSSLSVLHQQGGYFAADEYGLLSIEGKDAASFLQSQLSNDLNKMSPGKGQFSCLLDKKAHIQAYFHLFMSEEPISQTFYLLAEKEQIPDIVRHIEQYRFAANLQYTDLSKEAKFISIQGPRINKLLNSLEINEQLERLSSLDTCDITCGGFKTRFFRHSTTSENGYFFQISPDDYAEFYKLLADRCSELGFTELPEKVISIARIEAGILKQGIDFDKENLLSETGLTENTVSYTKGCFIGQEVLARIRSHGLPARAIIGLTIESANKENLPANFPLNTPIMVENEQIGNIRSNTFSPTLNKFLGLAYLKRDYRIPEKKIIAQIDGQPVTAIVTVLPFIKSKSNQELAHTLYEQAVQKFVQESENNIPIEAIAILKEVLLLDAQFEDAYEALAVISSKHERLEEAIALMKKLSQLNPDSVMAHSNLSQFYIQQGLKEAAEEEKAIALSIRMKLAAAEANVSAQKAKATEKENEDIQRRMEMFKQVLTIDSEDFFANAGIGDCLVGVEEYKTAIPYLEKAIDLKPTHLSSYCNLAKAYQGTGAISLAKELIESGIAVAAKRGDMVVLQQLQSELASLSQLS